MAAWSRCDLTNLGKFFGAMPWLPNLLFRLPSCRAVASEGAGIRMPDNSNPGMVNKRVAKFRYGVAGPMAVSNTNCMTRVSARGIVSLTDNQEFTGPAVFIS